MSTVKKFSLDGSQYDLETYWGRVCHFVDMVDPRNNFVSTNELEEAAKALMDVRAGRTPPKEFSTDASLWEAKKKFDSAIHPDTGETIPLFFRMSFFMPSNLPITAGMLLSGTGMRQVFWQWLNQSYNAGFNYANRNATVPIDTTQLMTSYAVATGVACGMSFSLGKVLEKLQKGASGAGGETFGFKLLSRGLPWMAVASAGTANALAMRYKEGVDGISVFDEHGNKIGTSVSAGRAGLVQVALTRAALPVPILLIPPFIIDYIRTTGLGPVMAKSVPIKLAVELSILAVFLQGALPLAVALFPQKGTIAASDLEKEFQNRLSPTTNLPITTYVYNKGL